MPPTLGPSGPHANGTTRTAHHPNRYRVIWEFVDGEKVNVGCHRAKSPTLKAFHERTLKLMQHGAPVSSAMKRP